MLSEPHKIVSPYTLRPYQLDAVSKMIGFLHKRKSCYNGSEQGLGKTIQTIVTLNSLDLKNVLIVCPAIMRLVWKNEYTKWNTVYKQTVATVLSSKDLPLTTSANVVIISYDLLARVATDKFLLRDWDCLVMDEAHNLARKTTLRTKTVLGKYWKRCKYRIALSGTPFRSSLIDAFPVWNMMAPEHFSNFHKFAYTYTNVRFNGFAKVYEGAKNVGQLSKIIRENFFIRYKLSEVEKEIPGKVYTKIPLPKSLAVEVLEEDREEIEQEIKELQAALDRGAESGVKATGKLIKNRQEQGLRKVDSVVEFAEEQLKQNIPIVIFAWHKSVVHEIAKRLSVHLPGVITGETRANERQQSIENFQEGKSNIIIANILAGGVGITLTRSSTCIFAEFDYSPANLSQAISRLVRIGQTKMVQIFYMVVEDSLEERILNIVMKKVISFNEVLDGKRAA